MRRRWLWFYVPLAVLAAVALVIPIVYNLRLQLTPVQLSAARERWQMHGTPDYNLLYSAHFDSDLAGDEYWVKVRGGRAVEVVCNGQVLRCDDVAGLGLGLAVRVLPAEDVSDQTVVGFFRHIDEWLREDASTGRRNYATASFDVRDGHPNRYVRRLAGTRKRLEWQIRLIRVDSGEQSRGERRDSP